MGTSDDIMQSMRYVFFLSILLLAACTASTGDADTDYKVGQLYLKGTGVMKDVSEAAVYFTKAAKAGSAEAQFALGVLYHDGNGVKLNVEKSVELFQKSAKQGLAQAQYNLGNAYRAGDGTAQNFREALLWYEKAAMQGYAPAAHNLGAMAGNGEGTPQNYAEAYKWLHLSEKLGTTADSKYKQTFAASLTPASKKKIEAEVKILHDQIAGNQSSSQSSVAR